MSELPILNETRARIHSGQDVLDAELDEGRAQIYIYDAMAGGAAAISLTREQATQLALILTNISIDIKEANR